MGRGQGRGKETRRTKAAGGWWQRLPAWAGFGGDRRRNARVHSMVRRRHCGGGGAVDACDQRSHWRNGVNNVISVTVLDIEALAARALRASNVIDLNAEAVARSIAAAERDGQRTVGLSYLPTYCDHASCRQVHWDA